MISKKYLLIFFLLSTFSISSLAFTEAKLENAKELYYAGETKKSKEIISSILGCCDGEEYYYLALISEMNGDEHQSFSNYKQAAENGFPPAMPPLSRSYRLGLGVKVNIIKSIDWERKSKKIERHRGVDISFIDSKNNAPIDILEKWKKKAKEGDAYAHYRLAKIYDEGLLENQNLLLAFNHYQKASELGNVEAKLMTGYFYCKGITQNKNKDKANKILSSIQKDFICK